MKKNLKLLLLPLFILGLTGCGNSPEETLKEAISNNNKAESYHIEYQIDIGMKADETEIEIPLEMSMDVDNKTNVAAITTTIEMFETKISTNSFVDMKTNTIYTKSLEEDSWTKQITETSMISNMLGNFSKVEKKEGTENEKYYQVTISQEDYKNTLALLKSSTGNSFTLKEDIIVDVYIDKKSNYVTKTVTDLAKSVGSVEGIEYSKLKLTMTYHDFNKVSVNAIDQNIIDHAVIEE